MRETATDLTAEEVKLAVQATAVCYKKAEEKGLNPSNPILTDLSAWKEYVRDYFENIGLVAEGYIFATPGQKPHLNIKVMGRLFSDGKLTDANFKKLEKQLGKKIIDRGTYDE